MCLNQIWGVFFPPESQYGKVIQSQRDTSVCVECQNNSMCVSWHVLIPSYISFEQIPKM